MNKLAIFLVCVSLLAVPSFQFSFFSQDSPLDPVPELDLTKYGGKWYEIARFNYIFEYDCYCAIAEYSLNDDETVKVQNTCNWGGPTKKLVSITGKAYPQDPVHGTITTGKFTVKFFPPTSAPYYVIDLDKNYQYALVGEPSRKYLWILARTRTISDDLYNRLVNKAKSLEFDVSKLIKVYQKDDCSYKKEEGNEYYINY